MNVTATLDGEVVTIADIEVNGLSIYISYVDSSNLFRVKKKFFPPQAKVVTIATSAVVN